LFCFGESSRQCSGGIELTPMHGATALILEAILHPFETKSMAVSRPSASLILMEEQ
jgi:hypothetical protein